VETQTDGSFSFADIDAAPVDLVAYKEGLTFGGISLYVPGMDSVPIVLSEGASLKIRVKSPAYDPLEGARLKSIVINDSIYVPLATLEENGLSLPRSAEDGTLSIGGVPKDGHVSFVLSHRRYANTTVAYLPIDDQERTILLYPGVALRGRVTAQGKGVADAEVSVLQLGSGGRRDPAVTRTDPEGFYHVIVKAGEHTVSVRHPKYVAAQPQRVSIADADSEAAADITLTESRTIEGRVLYPDGAPSIATPVAYWVDDAFYDGAFTQLQGQFTLRVPDVPGAIRIIPPDGFMTEAVNSIAVSGQLKPKTKLSPIKLIALPAVEGKVVGPDGEPQPNVVISSLDLQPPLWAVTDSDGHFRLQLSQAPPDGKASFKAEHAERFLRAQFEVTFPNPKSAEVTLAPFDPDLEKQPVASDQNDLSSLLGRDAHPIDGGMWFNSEALTLESLRGKVVVLTFWGGFDQRPVAVQAMQELSVLSDVLKGADDVAFVGIHDAGSDSVEIRKAIDRYNITFPVACDAEGFKTFEKYNIRYIPQTVLIDKKGKVRQFQTTGRLLELIKSLRREGE